MNKPFKLHLKLLLFMISASVLDLYSTWLCTPDLARESNRVLAMLGPTWPNLILIKLIPMSALWIMVILGFNKDASKFYPARGCEIKDFVNKFFFRESGTLLRFFYKNPQSPWLVLRLLSALGFGTFSFGALIAFALNTISFFRPEMAPSYNSWGVISMFSGFISACTAILIYFKLEYSWYTEHMKNIPRGGLK